MPMASLETKRSVWVVLCADSTMNTRDWLTRTAIPSLVTPYLERLAHLTPRGKVSADSNLISVAY